MIRDRQTPLTPPTAPRPAATSAAKAEQKASVKPARDQLHVSPSATQAAKDAAQAAPRDVATALQEADQLWFGFGHPGDRDWRRVEREGEPVNATDVHSMYVKTAHGGEEGLMMGEGEYATRQMKLNQALETEALGKLSADQVSQYRRVSGQLASNPRAQLGLQLLLVSGKMPGTPNHAGDDVLGALNRLVDQPLDPGVSRDELLGQLVRELATPTAIDQNDKGTCSVTALELLMALDHPAEYVRVVAGLASPEGKVQLTGGDTVQRLAGTEKDDGSQRSVPARLFQAAMMEYGNASGNKHYDNATDLNSDKVMGLPQTLLDKVHHGLTGDTITEITAKADTPDGVVAKLRSETSAGRKVLVDVNWGEVDDKGTLHEAHEILVTRLDADRVYYDNPWGREESMNLDEFKKRLLEASLATPPAHA